MDCTCWFKKDYVQTVAVKLQFYEIFVSGSQVSMAACSNLQWLETAVGPESWRLTLCWGRYSAKGRNIRAMENHAPTLK